MISLREARAIIAQNVPVLPPERQILANAFERVLRQPVLAREDIPAFDRSAMDGYALLEGDDSERLKVIGEVAPGSISSLTLYQGECVRILTGAAIPTNAGRVYPQEWVEREGDIITVKKRDGQNFIRQRGEEAKEGDVLLGEGLRLRAGELSLLAQVGEVAPIVSPRPRVAHIATGDELVPPDQVPGPGQIRDSNSTLIRALLLESGAELVTQERCGDDQETLRSLLEAVLSRGCDLLLISGGASVGDYDFGPRVLEQLGFKILFRQLDLRPGKPLVFAVRGEQVAFVIPGNPVSHFVTFQVAIRAALDRLEGRNSEWPLAAVKLLSPIPVQRDSREAYWPARLSYVDGRLCAEPLKWQSSGDLRGLVQAGGLLQILPGMTPLERGQEVPCLFLNAL